MLVDDDVVRYMPEGLNMRIAIVEIGKPKNDDDNGSAGGKSSSIEKAGDPRSDGGTGRDGIVLKLYEFRLFLRNVFHCGSNMPIIVPRLRVQQKSYHLEYKYDLKTLKMSVGGCSHASSFTRAQAASISR